MRGSIFKRCPCPVRRDASGRPLACPRKHGSWTFRVDVPASAGQTRRQLTRGGFPTKAAAEQALREALEPSRPVPAPGERRLRLADYLERWLQACTLVLERPAWTNYERVVALYVRPHLTNVLLAELQPAALSALYVTLATRGGQHGQPLSTTTVRLVHRVLHKALADAVIEGVLAANPADRVRPPRRRTAETPIWTATQIQTFLTAAQDDPLYPAWLLALTCGLRRGELAGLRWLDADLDAATLTIANQRTTDAATKVVTKAPKGTSRRTLDLGPAAITALRAHRARQEQDLDFLGRRPQPDTLLFLREDGSPHLPARLTELFQAASQRAGLPVIRLHDARHSCATLALSAGIHPKVVQQLLGHASWSTTMDLYTHRVERLQRDATTRIEALVQPAVEGSAARPARGARAVAAAPAEQAALF